jgi:peptidyl-prolyl cis-trans isomerase SurA
MTLRILRTSAAFVFATLLLASSTLAQTHPAAPESPYGGITVEEIIARVNNQIITRSDYDRAMKELDAEAHQRGESMQEISAGHRDLLRNLIDQQLWLSKGKELGINGDTELVTRLNEIRKQYNMETIEDLETAAKEQGVSFEDFKANIRNQIITQNVMRQEVGKIVQRDFTPGEVERYFEQHKQDYVQPESVTLSEILISTGTLAPSTTENSGVQPDDPQKLAAAKAKADDLEAKLNAGGDFAQLARNFSDGTTAAEGGDLGQFQRGKLAQVLEDKTFALKAGQFTEPIRTKQGYVILKVVQHIPGGVPEYKSVENQVEQDFYASRTEPAMREYLTKMRDEAFINIKPGYEDSGATPGELRSSISFSAYTPPAAKKKAKVERTRFRENTRSFRQKSAQAAAPAAPAKKAKNQPTEADQAVMKPGKKEKIRFGQAPTKTLPNASQTLTEDAGASASTASAQTAATPEPINPLESKPKPTQKTRYSARAPQLKRTHQAAAMKTDFSTPSAPDAAEVADRQIQAAPLGLAGDTSKHKKKKATTTGDKTRLTDKKKAEAPAQNSGNAPLAAAPQSPAPTPAPAPAPEQQK